MIPGSLHEPMLNACDAALDRVLASEVVTRETARELLAADAFVTVAFEAAAGQPATIAERADAAMRRISRTAVRYLDAPLTVEGG